MLNDKTFISKPRKKVLFSNDFREVLITQDTSIIEQRIITIILTSIKDAQSLLIPIKVQFDNSTIKQLSFDDCYDGWANQGVCEFLISLNQLNPERKMRNSAIQTALVNMSNINWFRLRDETINGYKAVPFIIEPRWNTQNIYFKMDKAVMKHLLNMSQFFPLRNDLTFKASTPNTLKFLLWLLKYQKFGGVEKEYFQLLKELAIHINKYDSKYRFERDFLKSVKADLDSDNDISFNYSFSNNKYRFVIYNTKISVGKSEVFVSINDLQISRSLKYLKKRRLLKEKDLRVLKQLYDVHGYSALATQIKRKIKPDIFGDEFIKAIFKHLENV
ncbi:hypothetical protein [Frigoriflavimonas asaccharolytica]|uniref:Uncharacterized protein n=1 Tax=Frigoriflavimonas asaccharolytica TaxID=2735899 RepID=A0A8J8G8T4_9FLAO|nr:hypothetical protein [Frigoriflavimonas asaccharolytica]NRS91589.1 hypothetical protein [Frigoriflavimonas asaccharolytica]